MSCPIELSMFDYSDIFLPVQVLNQQVVDAALSIDDLRESMDIDVETNDLSNAMSSLIISWDILTMLLIKKFL